MNKNDYRAIELKVGRELLGKNFDKIFEQNPTAVKRSSLQLKPGITLAKEPASIRDRPRLITRVWTDGANAQGEIRQIATAGEFLFGVLKNGGSSNHIALVKTIGHGHNGNKIVIDKIGEVSNHPLFLDNGLCSVLNLRPQSDESEAVQVFLTAYFELVKGWI